MKKFTGRFANNLFEYAWLRQVSGGDYQCAPWVGQKLFDLTDPPIFGPGNDISGQFPKVASAYDKTLFRKLFVPAPEFQLNTIAEQHAKGRPVIGIHLRRGDYGTFQRKSAKWCFVAPTQWYKDWLNSNLHRFVNPILYLASDEPEKVLPDFTEYDVVYPGPEIPDAPFWRDFYCLTQCDTLLISNSTFGFAAGMLNERALWFYRPRLSEQKLIQYNPWNAPLVFKDERYA
jgi:hypothetical protein